MKFNDLTKEQKEIAISIIIDRLNMWEQQNAEYCDINPEIISFKTHKDYVLDNCNNVIWIITDDGTLDYELA